jgi:hypothetical protein
MNLGGPCEVGWDYCTRMRKNFVPVALMVGVSECQVSAGAGLRRAHVAPIGVEVRAGFELVRQA